jgi:hypothetical protein
LCSGLLNRFRNRALSSGPLILASRTFRSRVCRWPGRNGRGDNPRSILAHECAGEGDRGDDDRCPERGQHWSRVPVVDRRSHPIYHETSRRRGRDESKRLLRPRTVNRPPQEVQGGRPGQHTRIGVYTPIWPHFGIKTCVTAPPARVSRSDAPLVSSHSTTTEHFGRHDCVPRSSHC